MNKTYAVVSSLPSRQRSPHQRLHHPLFKEHVFRGHVIDAQGKEQLITEQMILEACNAMEHWTHFIPTAKFNTARQRSKISSKARVLPIR